MEQTAGDLPRELTFAIVPPKGEHDLTLGAFFRSVGSIRRLIGDVDWAVEGRRRQGRWLVERLESSAPTVTIRPASDGAQTVEAIASGLHLLTRADELREPPPYFSDFALRDLQDMGSLFRGREAVARIDVARGTAPVGTLDPSIEPRVERIYRAGYTMLGSVEGRLDAINLHGRGVFTVWDRLTGSPVRCALSNDPQTIEQVKSLLTRSVLVAGRVSYFAHGVPRAISEITEITPLPTRDEFRLRASFGSIPDLTGDVETDEFVRTRRD